MNTAILSSRVVNAVAAHGTELPEGVHSFRLEIDDMPAAVLYVARLRHDSRTVRAAVVRLPGCAAGLETTPLVCDWVVAVLCARFPDASVEPLPLQGVGAWLNLRAHSRGAGLPANPPEGRAWLTFASLLHAEPSVRSACSPRRARP